MEFSSPNALYYGAKGDGTTDDTAALQVALNARKIVQLPAGTYRITSALVPQNGGGVVGAGVGLTNIQAYNLTGPAIYAPAGAGRLDGFTLIGNSTGGSVGILGDDDHSPNRGRWGDIEISLFEVGFKLIHSPGSAGIYHNEFGSMGITLCGTGIYLDGWDGATFFTINNNHWDVVTTTNCITGLNIVYAAGVFMNSFSAENGTDGIIITHGHRIIILGGWLESCTNYIHIENVVKNFVYLGSVKATFEELAYTYNEERSDLIPWRHGTYGSPHYQLCGRWFFQHLEAAAPGKFVLLSPDGSRWSLSIDNAGVPAWTKLV
jgi:hypothetical protein